MEIQLRSMIQMEYSNKVMETFRNPKNIGEIKNAGAVGKVGNPTCGDLMWLFLKFEKKNNEIYIKDVKVKTFGCVAAIASSSILTEMIKGKPLKYAESLEKTDIVNKLDGLPKQKIHCSLLALDALKDAVQKYRKKQKQET